MNSLALFTIAVSLAGLTQAQTCYFADGSISPQDVPCKDITGGGASMCCAANEYCWSNGLCVSPGTMTFNRGSCTDQSWNSNDCAKYCMTELYAGLWACDSKNDFSCTPNNCTDTFQVPGGKVIPNGQLNLDLGLGTSSSASASATATSTVTVTQTQTTTPTNTGSTASSSSCSNPDASLASHNSGVSSVAAAGIGIGVGLPLLILLIAALFLLHREKEKTRKALQGTRPPGLAEMHAQNPGSYHSQSSDYYRNQGPPPPAFVANPAGYAGFSHQQMKPAEMAQHGDSYGARELSATSPTFKR